MIGDCYLVTDLVSVGSMLQWMKKASIDFVDVCVILIVLVFVMVLSNIAVINNYSRKVRPVPMAE